VLSALDPATGDERWSFVADGLASLSPTVDGGTVYAGGSTTLYAVEGPTPDDGSGDDDSPDDGNGDDNSPNGDNPGTDDGDSDGDTNSDGGVGSSADGDGPGFGVLVVVLALVAGGLLARVR